MIILRAFNETVMNDKLICNFIKISEKNKKSWLQHWLTGELQLTPGLSSHGCVSVYPVLASLPWLPWLPWPGVRGERSPSVIDIALLLPELPELPVLMCHNTPPALHWEQSSLHSTHNKPSYLKITTNNHPATHPVCFIEGLNKQLQFKSTRNRQPISSTLLNMHWLMLFLRASKTCIWVILVAVLYCHDIMLAGYLSKEVINQF